MEDINQFMTMKTKMNPLYLSQSKLNLKCFQYLHPWSYNPDNMELKYLLGPENESIYFEGSQQLSRDIAQDFL